MGAKDIERQELNVFKIETLGASIVPVHSGTATLKDALNEAIRDWVTNVDTSHYIIGSVTGPHPYPTIVRDFNAISGKELKEQSLNQFKALPDMIIACVGGGSNAMGVFHPFIEDTTVELIGVEAGGPKNSKLHAAPLSRGAKLGILHGAAAYCCQDNEGQIKETESISAGLDYPSVSPIHCFLKDTKRARYTFATDEEALNAYKLVTKFEKLNPSLEPSHAFAEAIKIAPKLSKDTIIIVNSCGDAKKDRDILKKRLGKY